eukprot:GEMP01063210.1.p1 GENE.GEMP01063210.1~~GEMP01063210.1.p1  ORF type:complete len:143 (+),score=34.51 GEMP01063210.1:24-431(+)
MIDLRSIENTLLQFPYLRGFAPSADDNDAFERQLACPRIDKGRFPNIARWRAHMESILPSVRAAWGEPQEAVDCSDVTDMRDRGVVQEWSLPDDFEEQAQKQIAKEREITPFMKGKLHQECVKNWNRFYKRNLRR